MDSQSQEVGVMPQKAWSAKRERQYEHIKEGLRKGGRSEGSPTSRNDISSGRRGGLRSHRGSQGRTRDQLYEEAKDLGIEGRSSMTKRQFLRAVNRRCGRSGS